MRKLLNSLYDGTAALAALMMVGTLLMVVLGMVDRFVSLNFRGTDMYAGYCMAAAGFLALAHTLKRNEHIRVTLLLTRGTPAFKRGLEIWSLTAAVVLSGLFFFYSARLCYQSFDFKDISTGNDATPLWIPQLGMAIGTFVLLVAFIDELVMELAGKRAVINAEGLRNE
jgi:TRAP-type C4-dicarboxylate transport system permease small subunit